MPGLMGAHLGLDQLAKPTFCSRYSVQPQYLLFQARNRLQFFVTRSRKVCQLSGVSIGRAKIFVILVSHMHSLFTLETVGFPECLLFLDSDKRLNQI